VPLLVTLPSALSKLTFELLASTKSLLLATVTVLSSTVARAEVRLPSMVIEPLAATVMSLPT